MEKIHWELFKAGKTDYATFDKELPIEIIAENGPAAREELKKELKKVGAEPISCDTIPKGKNEEGKNSFHAWGYTVEIKYAEKNDFYKFLPRGTVRDLEKELSE